jgi:hypothetical protein
MTTNASLDTIAAVDDRVRTRLARIPTVITVLRHDAQYTVVAEHLSFSVAHAIDCAWDELKRECSQPMTIDIKPAQDYKASGVVVYQRAKRL